MDTSLNPNAQSYQPHLFFPQKQIEDKIELDNPLSHIPILELKVDTLEDTLKGKIRDKKLSDPDFTRNIGKISIKDKMIY